MTEYRYQISPVTVNNMYRADTIPSAPAKVPESTPENLKIYFAFDKSEFSPDAATRLSADNSAAYLLQNPGAKLSITGYTDSIGSSEYNMALGQARALSAKHYFVSRGVPPQKIMVQSMGERDPSGDNNTSAGRAVNRRTLISVNK